MLTLNEENGNSGKQGQVGAIAEPNSPLVSTALIMNSSVKQSLDGYFFS
jgi:hypothetical protein